MIQDFINYKRDPHKKLAKQMLRNLKERFIFINNLSINLDKIPPSILEDCRTLSDMGLVMGGSIALTAYGVLDRGINDFDLFLNEDVSFERLKREWESPKPKGTHVTTIEDIFDFNSEQLLLFRNNVDNEEYEEKKGLIFNPKIEHLKNSDKKIDIFNIRKGYTKIDGINIQTDIFCTLEAKVKYFREKDKQDFKVIFDKLIN